MVERFKKGVVVVIGKIGLRKEFSEKLGWGIKLDFGWALGWKK